MSILIDIGTFLTSQLGMATGPVLGYVHQYFLIKIQKSPGTFSIDICGILLFANILRLNFYLFNQYELALFFQSLIMITAQTLLVRIITKYSDVNQKVKLQSQSVISHSEYEPEKPQKIWRWNQFSSYFIFITLFAISTFTISVVFKKLQFEPYGVLIGLIALLSQVLFDQPQSMLILPQILQNYRSQSTKGLSRPLVGLNLSGDILKLIYFLMKDQAFQFIMCGIIQVILDSFVVIQIFYYGRLADQKFEKQNKSLIIEKKKSFSASKPQSETKLDEIEMKVMDQLSPEADDSIVLQTSYGSQQDSSRINEVQFNSSQVLNEETQRDPEGEYEAFSDEEKQTQESRETN